MIVWALVQLNVKRLKNQQRRLEELIDLRTSEIRHQKEEIEFQKTAIERQNEEIKASITYSKRIQDAILPEYERFERILPHIFIFFKPRDIISGDIYWFAEKNDKALLAVVDCTGHGVPGALMSMIAHDKLHQIINEKNTTDCAYILTELDNTIQTLMQQQGEANDGMDLALVTIDFNNHTLQYAGAKNPIYYTSKGILHEIKASRYSIGGSPIKNKKIFENHLIHYQPDDFQFFLFSDGFKDQFGGVEDTKFGSKQFKNLLDTLQKLPLNEQKIQLEKTLKDWQQNAEQTDDILVVGVKL
jgi:serine phosphatase RsbU (regulator of sigma subunit)